jgi:Undecaprenyl-phosphate glucose phosphotransferase
LRVVGVVTHQSSPAETVAGKKVLAHYGIDSIRVRELVRELKVDQVLIALSRQHYADLDEILRTLRDETVDIQLVPDIHEYVTLGCAVEDFDGLPLVNLNDSPLEGWGALAKRFTDMILAAGALFVLSPLLGLLATLIRLTSPGPVFFKQERMGLDGRTFWMLKFRSMRMNAEAETGAVWAQKGDERRTVLGGFLRATSLDELPQFWNVLLGEMSLVGPRPERPVFVQKFRNEIPHYMLRHKVKAGITGWAQINGWRGNTALDRRIECDLYYIRNWSYFLDLKILAVTCWRGFINKNAY